MAASPLPPAADHLLSLSRKPRVVVVVPRMVTCPASHRLLLLLLSAPLLLCQPSDGSATYYDLPSDQYDHDIPTIDAPILPESNAPSYQEQPHLKPALYLQSPEQHFLSQLLVQLGGREGWEERARASYPGEGDAPAMHHELSSMGPERLGEWVRRQQHKEQAQIYNRKQKRPSSLMNLKVDQKRWWGGQRGQMDRRASQTKHYDCLKSCIKEGKLHPIQCHTLC